MNSNYRLYKFSPIKTKEKTLEVIDYIATEMNKLCKKVTGQVYPIEGLTIFSHYPEEFEVLKEIVLSMGTLDSEVNGPYVKLKNPIQLKNNKLELLRIRNPDPYRLHVGCGDFRVPNYAKFKKEYLNKNQNNLRLISRQEYDMIEFFDPDFDVLAYILTR